MKSDNTDKVEILLDYFSEERDRLVKRISRRVNGEYNAEDVVQEAFVKAWLYLDAYEPERKPFGAWFNNILVNCAKDFNKAERNFGMGFTNEDTEELETSAFQKQVIADLLSALDDFPEPSRSVLRMFCFLGYRQKEISEVLNVNIWTVRKTIQNFYESARNQYGTETWT